MIGHSGMSLLARTVGAAKDESVGGLDPVADDPSSAIRAGWGQCLDGAFEAIENELAAPFGSDVERTVITVTAD
jgi:hypothetical protein